MATRTPPEKIETDRLILRKPVMADAQVVFDSYAQDPEVSYFMSWRPHVTVATTEAYMQDNVDGWESGTNHEFIITRADSPNGLLGMIGLHGGSDSTRRFGYVLAKEHWGQGYATEALSALVNWCLEQSDVWRVQSFCDCENLASRNVMEKAGLEFEGRLRRYFVHPNISAIPRDCFMLAIAKQ